MDFAFNPGQEFATARLILKAILLSLLGIFHLIAFIAARRWHRARYFRRPSERTLALRSQWNGIIDGTVCPRTWRLNRLDCELVEAMLLDSIEAANAEQLPGLLACLVPADYSIFAFTRLAAPWAGGNAVHWSLWAAPAHWRR